MLRPSSPASVLDQDAAHGLGRSGEEVAAPVPVLPAPVPDQAHIRFVDQCRGLQCLPWLFAGELLGRQPAQLVVEQGKQLVGGMWLALLDGRKDARDLVHAVESALSMPSDETVRRTSAGKAQIPPAAAFAAAGGI